MDISLLGALVQVLVLFISMLKGTLNPVRFATIPIQIYLVPLVEALRSKFFTTFRNAQPFSKNPLRPCPLIDNPQAIIDVVNVGGAKSTHLANPESAEALAMKNFERAKEWEKVSKELYRKMPEQTQKNFSKYLEYYAFKKRITDGRRKKL